MNLNKLFVPAVIIILFFACVRHVSAQVSEFSITPGRVQTVDTYIEGYLGMPRLEVTPDVIGLGNGIRLYLLPTGATHLCQTYNRNILTGRIAFLGAECQLVDKPEVIKGFNVSGYGADRYAEYIPPDQLANNLHWKRNYSGLLGMHLIDNGQTLVAVRHGENANTRVHSMSPNTYYFYQNSMNPQPPVATCYDQYDEPNAPRCWEGFYSFVSAAYLPHFDQVGFRGSWVDVGPIDWPSVGYVVNGASTHAFYYHNTSYADDQYLYAYTGALGYTDAGIPAGCTTMSRAPLSQAGNPAAWRKYYNGSFSELSVPVGFDKDNIPAFAGIGGGRESCIFSDDVAAGITDQYLNVARVNGTPYYLAVQERTEADTIESVGLRLSSDLIHWSDFVPLERATGSWGTSRFTYPTLYNKDATSTDVIDADEFYLMGDQPFDDPVYNLRNMQLSLNLSCPVLAAPANLQVLVNNPSTGIVTLKWGSVAGARSYALRIDDTVDAWDGSCTGNDICAEHLKTPSYSFFPKPGHSYKWWSHEVSFCDHWSNWSTATVGPSFTYQAFDINSDGLVNVNDVVLLGNAVGTSGGAADVNRDSYVNSLDFLSMYQYFQKGGTGSL